MVPDLIKTMIIFCISNQRLMNLPKKLILLNYMVQSNAIVFCLQLQVWFRTLTYSTR